MILVIMNWIYVTLTAGIIGIGFFVLFHKITGYKCHEIDVCLFMGIALVTAYAEIFSLFYKVAGLANVVLIFLCLLIGIVCKKHIVDLVKTAFKKVLSFKKEKLSKVTIIRIVLVIVTFVLFLLIACQRAYHADTDLYHTQAIRWIEEYGVVKGLGNLHHRLAYNSAFMSLQALYSWTFLIDQSMHVMNAYLCMIVTMYVLVNCFSQKQTYKLSGCLAFVILLYDIINMRTMPSPGTDHFALLFMLYLIIKWCDYIEEKDSRTESYGILCILALYILTVKLSVAMIMILTIKPALELLKKKRYQTTLFMIITGLFLLLPFCIRNFIISGYFIYPSVITGFFDVDWKMLPYSVEFDKMEIASYAKGVYDKLRYREVWNMSIIEWFPTWWQTKELWFKIMLASHIVLLPVFIGINIVKIAKKRTPYDMVLNIAVLVQFFYWLFMAPLSRYGGIVLFLIPCMVLIHMMEDWKKTVIKVYQTAMPFIMALLIICLVCETGRCIEKIPLKRSSYYIYRECDEIAWEGGITMYTPIENCYTGYYYFPGLTYPKRLKYLELRGDSIEDGFRIKQEYRQTKLTTTGEILE